MKQQTQQQKCMEWIYQNIYLSARPANYLTVVTECCNLQKHCIAFPYFSSLSEFRLTIAAAFTVRLEL